MLDTVSTLRRRWLAMLLIAAWPMAASATLPIQSWQTAAGARVLLIENRDLPMLDVKLEFPAGSAWENGFPAGTASLTNSLVSAGTAHLNEQQVADRLADTGAQVSPSVDEDSASFSLRTLSDPRERDAAVALLAELLSAPAFPDSIVERDRARTVSALKEAETRPETLAERAFAQSVFGSHPYARSSSSASVASITRDHLLGFYAERYRVAGVVLTIVGDIDRAGAEALAERLTAGLPQGRPLPDRLPVVERAIAGAMQVIDHPATQSHILVGAPGMKRGDPDYWPLFVGNYILGGGGFASRLTDEVRQKRGLAYSVYSYFLPRKEDGPFMIGLQTKREQTDEALAVVRQTLERFVGEGPTEAELAAARSNLVGGFPLRVENNRKILDYVSMVGFYGLPLDYIDRFVSNIESVTVEQIRDAFRRRVQTDRLATVVVGGGNGR